MPGRDNYTTEGRAAEPIEPSDASRREDDNTMVMVDADGLRELRDELMALADRPDRDLADLMGRSMEMSNILIVIQDEARPFLDGIDTEDGTSLVKVDAHRLDLAREDLQSMAAFAYEKGLSKGKGALRQLAHELTDMLGNSAQGVTCDSL